MNSNDNVKENNIRKERLLLLAKVLLPVFSVLICFFLFEFSIQANLEHLKGMTLRAIVLNLAAIGIVWCFFQIVCNKIWLSSLLTNSVCGLIAIINYYVIKFKGMPLSFLEVKNFATAMNVISNYKITIEREVLILLTVLLLVDAVCICLRRFIKEKKKSWQHILVQDILLAVVGIFVIYGGYFSSYALKPRKTIEWIWTEAYYAYGYMACTIESIDSSLHAVNKPEGYSEEVLDEIMVENSKTEESADPDVILILNETFFDLRQITDIETDVPYMENLDGMENLLSGYAVIPSIGGGTNSSEYELLTSNSLQLMPGVTPFNTLDLAGANSIVSHLNSLGYSSTGAHTESSVNYSRGRGYRDLGFEHAYFSEDFTDLEAYYDRWFKTDESVYKNLIRWYEDAEEENPRFFYLLTIQNHGGWERSDEAYDTVHVQTDYGYLNDQVNEYLTSIKMSDEAFSELTDYFSTVDRPVIVCMLGDHAPWFAANIIDEDYSEEEKELLLRTVPLYIWANYELEEQELGQISMNYVVPTLLEVADIDLSPYYQYMLNLKEEVPILSSYGVYYDTAGNLYQYDEEASAYTEAVNQYFYLEYNNLQENRKQEFFDAYVVNE